MKKLASIILIIVLVISLSACGGTQTTGQIASSLQSKTNELLNVVNELDNVNSNDIVISDISPMNSTNNYYRATNTGYNTNNNTNNYNSNANYNSLNKQYVVTGVNNRTNLGFVKNIDTYRGAKNYQPSYTQNYNMNYGIYNDQTLSARERQNYLRDVDPNERYTSMYNTRNIANRVNNYKNATDSYIYGRNNNYTRVNNTNNTNNTTRNNVRNINNVRNTNYNQTANNVNTTNRNNNNVNTNYNTTRRTTTPSGAYNYTPLNEPRNSRNYRYSPRYTNGGNDYLSRDNIDTYMGKVEDIYNLTSDLVYANTDLSTCNSILRQEVQKCNALCQNVKDTNVELTDDEKEALNAHLDEIKATIGNLRQTNGDIRKSVEAIKPLRTNFNNNMATINAKYVKILNALSSRINNCQIAIDSVTSCNNILLNKQGGGTTTTPTRYSYNTASKYNDQNINNNAANRTAINNTTNRNNTTYTPTRRTRVTSPARPAPVNQNNTVNRTTTNTTNVTPNNVTTTRNNLNNVNTNRNNVNNNLNTTTRNNMVDTTNNVTTDRRSNVINNLNTRTNTGMNTTNTNYTNNNRANATNTNYNNNNTVNPAPMNVNNERVNNTPRNTVNTNQTGTRMDMFRQEETNITRQINSTESEIGRIERQIENTNGSDIENKEVVLNELNMQMQNLESEMQDLQQQLSETQTKINDPQNTPINQSRINLNNTNNNEMANGTNGY